MQIKPVATWVFEPYLRKKSNMWSRTSHMLVAAKLAIDNVCRIYGKPQVYTDTLGRDILQQLTTNADYIVCYDNIYDQISSNLWMYPKLLTYQQQTDRYFHFDLDLICLRPFSGNVFDANIVTQNTEQVTEIYTIESYNVKEVRDFYTLPEIFYRQDIDQVPVYNLGFFYIDDLGFNQEYANTCLKIVNDNKQVIDTRLPVISPCTVEQQTLGLMLRDRPDLKIETLVDIPNKLQRWNFEFIHFFGWAKDHQHYKAKRWHQLWLSPHINDTIISIANSIDSLIGSQNV